MSLLKRIEEIERRLSSAHLKQKNLSALPKLVAVSKKQSIVAINEFLDLQKQRGQPLILGENYVQEFRDKKPELIYPVEAHLIGPLQRNKVKLAVQLFDFIESVHSKEILEEIDKQAAKENKVMPVLLQVNISQDAAKAGFVESDLNPRLMQQFSQLNNVSIRGLMTITQEYDLAELARPDFSALYALGSRLKDFFDVSDPCLSMGVSNDFEVAIEEGATHVRIGSAIFGKRQ